jgi:hypothetical protein
MCNQTCIQQWMHVSLSSAAGRSGNRLTRAAGTSSNQIEILFMKSLILAQNERWRRGLGMQVEREKRKLSTAA